MASEIVSLPAFMGEPPAAYPVSARTGEPRHPVMLAIASALCWLSIPVTIVAYARWWMICSQIDGFHTSARLVSWVKPEPDSIPALVLVLAVSAIAVLMVAAAGVAAYNAWTGQLWVIIGVWVALMVTGLSFLLNWWFVAAMAPLALGALLLMFPYFWRYCLAVRDFRHSPPPVVPMSGIKYGPQPLIGSRH